MEASTQNSTVDDTEDSDASLLIVNGDDDEAVAAASDSDVNMTDAVFSDGSASNPVFGTELTGATNSLCNFSASPSADVSGSATQDAAAETWDNVDCRRHRRRYYRRHRSSSGRRRHQLCDFKRKESNYMSATCHVIVIVLVCIAMTEPRWFYIQGGRCTDARHGTTVKQHLGIRTFFYQQSSSGLTNQNSYYYGSSLHDVLLDCVTPNVVFVLRVIIALCFLVMILSLTACLMDVFGPTHVICRALRFTASLSILSACTCVVITGLCYLVTQQLTDYYTKTRLHDTSKVLVEFNIGFYVITSAGALSVIAVTCTLMRRVHVSSSRRRRCVSDRRQAEADIERIADIAGAMLPPAGRTPPPYRR